MSLGIDEPASADSEPERPTVIGGSTRFVPGQSNDRITVVNGKVQLGQRLKDLWRNRDLLILLTRTELKVKYKNSVLGYAWSMLNPALVLAIYYVVFKIIARTRAAPLRHLAVLRPARVEPLQQLGHGARRRWWWARPASSRRWPSPASCWPCRWSAWPSCSSPSRWWCSILVLAALPARPRLDLRCRCCRWPCVALIVFTGAVSIFLSAVNVYLRDTQHLTEVLLMAWFWGTPDRLHVRPDLASAT